MEIRLPIKNKKKYIITLACKKIKSSCSTVGFKDNRGIDNCTLWSASFCKNELILFATREPRKNTEISFSRDKHLRQTLEFVSRGDTDLLYSLSRVSVNKAEEPRLSILVGTFVCLQIEKSTKRIFKFASHSVTLTLECACI